MYVGNCRIGIFILKKIVIFTRNKYSEKKGYLTIPLGFYKPPIIMSKVTLSVD